MINKELETCIYNARVAFNNGNYDTAEQLASEVLTELEKSGHSQFDEETPNEIEMSLRSQALLSLAQIHQKRGNFSHSLTFAEEVLAYLGSNSHTEATIFLECKAKALNILGSIYRSFGSYETSLENSEKALSLLEQLGNKSQAATLLANIGNVNVHLGNYERALECFRKALFTNEEFDNKSEVARITGNIGIVYLNQGSYNLAIESLQKALLLYEGLGEKSGVARILATIGNVYYSIGDYDSALTYYGKAILLHETLGEKSGVAGITLCIGSVYSQLGNFENALEYFGKALQKHEELGEKSGIAGATANIGNVYLELGHLEKALEYNLQALSLIQEIGDKPSEAEIMGNLGNVYITLCKYDKGLELYRNALESFEELDEKSGIALITGNIGTLYGTKEYDGYDATKSEEYLLKAIEIDTEIGFKQNLYTVHFSLAELYKTEKRWEDFAFHFQKFHTVEKQVQSEEATKQAQLMEHRRKIEESERNRQVKLARFQEQEKILHNILPTQIAERMINGEKTIADSHENVSVFFSDIVGFTKLSQSVSAEELVGMLNGIFTQFDQLTRKHGLEKIKTIGDAYMAVAGAPIAQENHAERAALFALDVAELMKNYHTETGEKIDIRIGLHTGSAVAGIIGENKFSYDLWGDAVNTASRMESHGEAGKIHVSKEFKHAVETLHATSLHAETLHATSLQFIRRGEMAIKGKGMMKTYFLEKAIL